MAIQRRNIEVNDEESKSLAYRVTPKEHENFKAICKKEGLTISAMLEKMVNEYLARRKNKGT